MRIATLHGERSVAELARRLFQLEGLSGNRAKEAAKEAESALRQANPHLQDIRRMAAGTLLVVPEVEGIRPAAANDEVAPLDEVRNELLEQLRSTLNVAREALEESAKRQEQEVRGSIEVSQERELRELARQLPELQERLPQIGETAKADLRNVEARRAMHKRGLSQLEIDMDDFAKLF